MANIVFISRYYPPEIGAAPVCVSEMATRLVKLGHQVTVLTTVPNYPTGIVPEKYRGHLIQSEELDGVRIIRVWSYIAANKGFLLRVLAHLCFGLLAPFLGWKEIKKPDIIIVVSPPLFNAIAGRILAGLKHCPFIFWVHDIWPESAIQLGTLNNRMYIRLSEQLERTTYQKANLVWTVTKGMRDTLIARGLEAERIFLLTNGVDCTEFRPLPFSKQQARIELGWEDRFTVLYSGGHGIVHGLRTILDVAERIRNRGDIQIIMAGEGSEKPELIANAQRRGINNIIFLDAQTHDRMPLLLAASDVSLVPALKVPIFQGMLPVKMFEAMACARPMVLSLDGDARQVAEQEAGAAIAVEPENADAIANAILYLYDHPQRAAEMGRRGRAYAQVHFDYDLLAEELDLRIAMLLGKKVTIPVIEREEMPLASVSTSSDVELAR